MNWSEIPSLAALRAFEAAARTQSLSAAARELNVTHAAISHHVRNLEGELGRALMVRRGRGVVPTEDGQALAASLGEGFGTIAAGVAELRDTASASPVQLSVTPAFAEHWLMPRIGDFWARHPDVPVNIAPSNDVVDLRRDGVDLAIRYGVGPWPPYQDALLTEEEFWVMGAPKLLRGRRTTCAADVADLIWLTVRGFEEQAALFEAADGIEPGSLRRAVLNTSALVMAGVREGLGVAIMSRSLVEREVAAGHLTRVCALEAPGLGYRLVTDPRRRGRRIAPLVRWLKDQARG